MKNGFIILALVLGVGFNSYAVEKVIYGDDNRLDLFEVTDQIQYDAALSTAAMIPNSALVDSTRNDGQEIKSTTLTKRGICSDQKFAEQITAANCTGFLVGKNLLVTAGHCIRNMSSCEDYKWVFGFALDESNDEDYLQVPKENIYSCVRIVERSLERENQNDFALVELDREVVGRTPLRVRTEGRIADHTPIFVIGHPTGLPSKIAPMAKVRNNSDDIYFQANLDTFGGNSGSPVFDEATGMVEGILVRGEQDYVFDREKNCRVPKVCTEDGCRGEDVTRITNIKSLMEILKNQ